MMSTITGTGSHDVLQGTNGDDSLEGLGGNDTFRASMGDDLLSGGGGFDVADYTTLSAPITLGSVGEIDKGNFGTDTIFQVEEIRGAQGFDNVIDGSVTGSGGAVSFDASLENQFLNVFNIPGIGQQNFTIKRFVDVIGTQGNDFIEGDQQDNFLDGQGGNDYIEGGLGADNLIGRDGDDFLFGEAGRDRLTGTDSFARGVDELDSLAGGAGGDRFVLGDAQGSFYKSDSLDSHSRFNGFDDRAFIDDFAFDDLIELGIEETYQVFSRNGFFDLYVVRGSVLDNIAVIDPIQPISVPEGEFSIASGQQLGIFVGA